MNNWNKFLSNFSYTLCFIIQILLWAGSIGCLGIMIAVLCGPGLTQSGLLHDAVLSSNLAANPDLAFLVINGDSIDRFALGFLMAQTWIRLGLTAMIFRNVCLIFKTAAGQTSFAEGTTPFQKPVVRMLREIGIFLLAMMAVQFLFSVICGIVFPARPNPFYGIDLISIALGFLMLCLSSWFSYGLKLQKEVDTIV